LTLAMWAGTAVFLIFSLVRDRQKTGQALKRPSAWAGEC
jgi:hypothetical protein